MRNLTSASNGLSSPVQKPQYLHITHVPIVLLTLDIVIFT